MEWIGCVRCKKSRRDFVARTFALIALVHPVLHRVSCSYEMIPNAPKHYATYQNMVLWSNGMDQVRSLRKITKWLRGTNFCTNCTSSARFAPSFTIVIKQSQMHLNTLKCTKTFFRVQWGGSGAFVAKKSDATSWHELLHHYDRFAPSL